MEDFIEHIKRSPATLTAIVIICTAIGAVTYVYVTDVETKKEPPKIEQASTVLPPSLDIDELLPKPPPEQPKPVAKKVKQKQHKNINQLIGISNPSKPKPDERDLIREDMLKRIPKQGKLIIAKKNNQVILPNQPRFKDISSDKDFSKHNMAKSIATFPVNLTRTLTADRFIPAVLYTEIKSELESEKVIAVIERDVYATHGRKILIPRGSKAIGAYEGLNEQGDTRLALAWHRIITPNGINIKLDSETASGDGSSGVTGEIDNRIKEKYGVALLFSTISALAQISVDTKNESQAAAADSFTDEFGTVTSEALRNSFDVVPRVRIPRGSRIMISPITDLWFPEQETELVQVYPLSEIRAGGELINVNFQHRKPRHFQYQDQQPLVKVERKKLKAPLSMSQNDLPIGFQQYLKH